KRNIRDHKRRFLVTKYELRRKLYKAFCKDLDLPSDIRDKLHYKLSKLPRNSSFTRVKNRCISTSLPCSISISRSFDGHKEIVLVATSKPIEQGLG
ncbi:hypothetical protein HN51_015913, partial [Arachis hypogaea]